MDRAMESDRKACNVRADGLFAGNLVAEAERATRYDQVNPSSDPIKVTP
jgi:hypothetical protein